jgi:hypothetical protein
MAQRIMPLYIFSGIIMAIGAYLTIRYRPYCTLKSPEREIAMELHRKKLLNESLSSMENRLYEKLTYQTKFYSIGNFLLFISSAVHVFVFAGNSWYLLSSIYYISLVCIIPLFISKIYFLPYCFQMSIVTILSDTKSSYLPILNSYWKKLNGKSLKKDEQRTIIEEESALKIFKFYRYSINTGVVLLLILDVWFGLSGSLMIPN